MEQLICCKAIESYGNIAFSQGCVIHPGCTIKADAAAIIFGQFNIVEQRVKILNILDSNTPSSSPLNIGRYNHFEVGTIVEHCRIGSFNEFQHRVYIQRDCSIGNCCIITAGVRLRAGTVVPDNTVVFGPDNMRPNVETEDNFRQKIRSLYEVLKKCLPKYNSLQQAQRQ